MSQRAAARFPASLLLRAQSIRLVILDVDGVLTDGGLYFTAEGESLKRFSVLDGQGIKMLQAMGITLAVITGRDSPALRHRLAALKIKHAVYATEDKLPAANTLLAQQRLSWEEVAVMGDDWPDLPMLRKARLACAPSNAHHENRQTAHWVTQARGGEGAVREMCDLILTAQGHYAHLLETSLKS
jgi:3-deoxy-D-manno-octulosonate 8-phosphate phosphatase (KDO 8-P phosphatase)